MKKKILESFIKGINILEHAEDKYTPLVAIEIDKEKILESCLEDDWFKQQVLALHLDPTKNSCIDFIIDDEKYSVTVKKIVRFDGFEICCKVKRDEIKHTFYPIKKKGAKYIHLKTHEVRKIVGFNGNFIHLNDDGMVHEDYFNEFYRLVDDED